MRHTFGLHALFEMRYRYSTTNCDQDCWLQLFSPWLTRLSSEDKACITAQHFYTFHLHIFGLKSTSFSIRDEPASIEGSEWIAPAHVSYNT